VRYLIDTNVVCELRKGKRCHPSVAAWIAATPADALFLSALVIGELHRGIIALRRTDEHAALAIEAWLAALQMDYADRVLPVTVDIVRMWAYLSVPDRLPVIDDLLAATAIVNELTLVTRNTQGVARTGVALLNPFDVPTPQEG
jgi:toxin FitB